MECMEYIDLRRVGEGQYDLCQQRLIRFMERLMRTSEQKVFLILDNLTLFPVSSPTRRFPIFAYRSNI